MLFKDRKKCETNIRPLYELFKARNKQIAMEFRGGSIVDPAVGGIREGGERERDTSGTTLDATVPQILLRRQFASADHVILV